ncbi:MAG: Spore protein SP21 [Verrucomicrobia bacterium ADurb.Bin345]|nr:MAG: Spore protein SP21 [Verrucomicrobia bacterium ADurb.Bin345]
MTQESKAMQTHKKENPQVELTRDEPVFTPATDIYEKPDAVLVMCDMPGVDEKNVDVTLESGVLTITGRQDAARREGLELLHQGYRTGIFRRTFEVSAEIDASKIDAKISKGVLRLVLPKTEQAQPRKIAVASGD